MKGIHSGQSIRWLIAAGLAASVLGCGGGGGGGDDTSPGPGAGSDLPALADYLLFNRYDFAAGQANSIVAVPRADPSAAGVTLTDNYDDLLIAHRALTDAAGSMNGAVATAGVIYFQPAARGAGRWQRISFADAAPQSVPVSSETAAPCADSYRRPVLLERRLTDERTFFVLYALAGSDGRCFTDDDAFKLIDYQADGAAQPVFLAGVRAVLGAIYRADGNLDGLLAMQDADLVYISKLSSFDDRHVLATGLGSAVVLSSGADEFHNDGQAFVVVRTTDGQAGIHAVRAGGQYSSTLYAAASADSTFASRADAQNLYVAEQYQVTLPSTATQPVTHLIRLSLAGNTQASPIHTFIGHGLAVTGVTEHNVVLSGSGPDAIGFDAIYPKAPAPGDTLKRFEGFVAYATASRLYMGGAVGNDASGDPLGGAIEADENGLALAKYPHGQWFGLRHQRAAAFPQDQRRPVDGALLVQAQSEDKGSGRRADASLYFARPDRPLAAFRSADGSSFTVSYRDVVLFEDSGASTELAGFDDGDISSINFELMALDFANMRALRITSTAGIGEYPVY
ncbi:hypothetical protein [Solimonas soli]|uniref:hypothetical protein n=1 Tax=Solimonas soli TaxID=413479 RepID=UPI0004AF2EC8|nr:hypothetical protein [Solimonas soli]